MNTNFSDLGLSEATLRALKRLNYQSPTEVQARAIPAALEQRDLAIVAKTGTGKTAAFALPLIDRVQARKGKRPSALILSPTRELAQQTETVLISLAKSSGHRIATLVGGVSYGLQMKRLRYGVDILIATPGRLIDMIDRKAISLHDVEMLVLDEADRMMDMGFLPAMNRVVELTPASRQTMLFSATMDRKVMNNVQNMVDNPLFIEVSHKGETADKVNQYIVPIAQKRKDDLLETVLSERGTERVIVFARTKNRSDICAEKLCRSGHKAEVIHSDRSQRERHRALDNFRKGKTDILVATDVLARGIDVSDVEYVINYDLPDCADDYVHRIGRTGRAGKEGDAISFVSSDARHALREIEKLVGAQIPLLAVNGFDCEKEAASLRAGKQRNGGKRQGGGKRPYGRSGSGSGKHANSRSGSGYGKKSHGRSNSTAPKDSGERISSETGNSTGHRSAGEYGKSLKGRSASGSSKRTSDSRFDKQSGYHKKQSGKSKKYATK